jgi:(S)-ureidoglycine aminohydrolase
MEKSAAVVHTSPIMGAGFTQYTAEMEASGRLGACNGQRFLYVLDGAIELTFASTSHRLTPNDYAYLPETSDHLIVATGASRVAVIEKRYQQIEGVDAPDPFVSSESSTPGHPLMGDPDLVVHGLLPDNPSFDFAVNTMTYQPGAALGMVEMHVMEHGLLMLEGGGIYRLDDAWYPVTAGDFIWMGAYCPQWFGALGKSPAKYLIYKDWNRHPLSR